MPNAVRLLMAIGTRTTMASSDHQATRRAALMGSTAAGAPASRRDAAASGGRDVSRVGLAEAAGAAAAAVRRAPDWPPVDWPPLARFFFLDLATAPLRHLAPRPVSTTRRVSATICASMASV